MTILLGVDCATQPHKTGFALGELHEGRVVITRCAIGSRSVPTAATILEWLHGCWEVLFAFDSPLGWPASLGEVLCQHSAGGRLAFESDALFRRAADVEIYRRLGKLPLEVGASWLARTAVAALGLLDELRQASGRPIPLAWAPGEAESWRVVEVYPAATRITHGVPDESGSIVGLSDVLDCSAVADVVTWSKDAGDACVCALAGADFLAGRAVPPEDVPTAHREGWIWAPDVQSPPRRTVVSSDSPEDRLPEADPVDSPERTPSPAGPASGEPACLACARGLPPTLPRVCPECHHVFRGNGWDGIDAHWKAKHEDVMPYRAFWDSLCADHKHGVRSQGRAFA